MRREIKGNIGLNPSSIVALVAGVLFFLLGAAFVVVSFSLFWSTSRDRSHHMRPLLLPTGIAWRMTLSDFEHSRDSVGQRYRYRS